MTRWTQLYDELAGARYPALVAYAGLLTGDDHTADALVAQALRRAFSRPRRRDSRLEAEQRVRLAIISGFLAEEPRSASTPQAGDGSPSPGTVPSGSGRDARRGAAGRAGGTGPAGDAAAAVPPPWERGEDTSQVNPYAPPTAGQEPGSAGPPALLANPAPSPTPWGEETEPARASAASREPEADPGTPPARMPREEDRVRTVLLSLEPRARVVAVLRHHDGLTPGQICAHLDLPAATVHAALRDVRAAVETSLGISLPEDPVDPDGPTASEITVADHAMRL